MFLWLWLLHWCYNCSSSIITDARDQIRSIKHRDLREAVTTGNETMVIALLDNLGPEKEIIVNMTPGGNNTLLFVASQSGSEKIIKLLLDSEADGRAHPVTRYSPLYTAVHYGHIKIVKLLLERFPELIQQLTVERWLPFHSACINGHCGIVELLLNYPYPDYLMQTFRDPTGEWEWRLPFDPNTQDVTGQTALYVTCLLGNKQLVELLLKWKVKSFKTNSVESPEKRSGVISPISPTNKRISFGIQSIMSRLSLGRDPIENSTNENYRNPLNLNTACGGARETALLAAVRGSFTNVVQLLLQNGADPNIVARPMEDHMNPKSTDEIYGFSNIPLAEAARQKSLSMVDLLLHYGAKDDQSSALSIAIANSDESIVCRLLAIKAHPDPDYKINKKALCFETDYAGAHPSITNFTYSTLFPNTATMINWHSNNCKLSNIRVNWLSEAVLQCNPKLKGHPKSHALALGALTRIDISHNCLTVLPPEIFGLSSLRYLNVAQNKLERIPLPEEIIHSTYTTSPQRRNSKTNLLDYKCPVLEELYLQDNRLGNIPPRLFCLANLTLLDVSNNKLQELPFELWKAPKLKELNVAFNLLKDLPILPSVSVFNI